MIVHFSAHISKWELVCKFGVIFHISIISCLCSRFHVRNQWFFYSVITFSYTKCFVHSYTVDVVFTLFYVICIHMIFDIYQTSDMPGSWDVLDLHEAMILKPYRKSDDMNHCTGKTTSLFWDCPLFRSSRNFHFNNILDMSRWTCIASSEYPKTRMI